MRQFIMIVLIAAAAGTTLFTAGATFAKLGVPSINEPQGISIKKESLRHRHGMLLIGRSHYGGGIRSHK